MPVCRLPPPHRHPPWALWGDLREANHVPSKPPWLSPTRTPSSATPAKAPWASWSPRSCPQPAAQVWLLLASFSPRQDRAPGVASGHWACLPQALPVSGFRVQVMVHMHVACLHSPRLTGSCTSCWGALGWRTAATCSRLHAPGTQGRVLAQRTCASVHPCTGDPRLCVSPLCTQLSTHLNVSKQG